jgi:hypothetical protein
VTASKVSAAMAAATHKTQVLPTTDFKPVIFSSSVAATSHQTQVFPDTDFELMTSTSGAKSKYATNRRTLASIWSVLYQGNYLRETTCSHTEFIWREGLKMVGSPRLVIYNFSGWCDSA